MNRVDAIVKALIARGEIEVTLNSAQRFRKFTRRYAGRRNADGSLNQTVNAESFWYVSKRNGSLRVGVTSAVSKRVKLEITDLLIKEGKLK